MGHGNETYNPVNKSTLSIEKLSEEDFISMFNTECNTIFMRERSRYIYSGENIYNNEETLKLKAISQSIIKLLTDKNGNEKEICPRNLYERYISNTVKGIPSKRMIEGNFAETLCIGSCSDGEKVTDLPRKKISKEQYRECKRLKIEAVGEKSINQKRIELQAEKFKMICNQKGIKISSDNTQVKIFKKYKDIILSASIDIFPIIMPYKETENGEEKIEIFICDLKFTGDLSNTFGDFCWSTPQYMDMVQGDMYHFMVEDIDFELNDKFNPGNNLRDIFTESLQRLIAADKIKFFFWVFEYEKDTLRNDMIIRRKYDENGSNIRRKELIDRINKSLAIIEFNSELGWPEKECESSCRYCPRSPKNKHLPEYIGECNTAKIITEV